MVTIGEALKSSVKKLEGRVDTPILDAQVILGHVLKVDRLYLITNRDRKLTNEEYRAFQDMIEKRLNGVPVQYIVKNQEFMGFDFYVEEGVLIPRPDTEILVEKVLSYAVEKRRYTIVDIGTGSGAISISLGRYIRDSYIYAIDIEDKAIGIAKKNAERLGVINKIEFLKGSIFEPLEGLGLHGKVDILVSNPPYIPSREIDKLQIEVSRYEPRIALDGGEDGLDFYREIIDKAHVYLKPGGLLALEIGYDQGERVTELLKRKGCYNSIEITKDLAGFDRVVTALL